MSLSLPKNLLLRLVLLLLGAVVLLMGLNVGLGGMRTMGWQGPVDFVLIADPLAFGHQDSHIRFLAGIWAGFGLIYLAAAVALQKLRGLVIATTGLVFLGGLMRLSALDTNILFSSAIAPSLAFELIAFPLLGLWLSKTVKPFGKTA